MSLRLSGVPGFPLGAIKNRLRKSWNKEKRQRLFANEQNLRQSYKEPAFLSVARGLRVRLCANQLTFLYLVQDRGHVGYNIRPAFLGGFPD